MRAARGPRQPRQLQHPEVLIFLSSAVLRCATLEAGRGWAPLCPALPVPGLRAPTRTALLPLPSPLLPPHPLPSPLFPPPLALFPFLCFCRPPPPPSLFPRHPDTSPLSAPAAPPHRFYYAVVLEFTTRAGAGVSYHTTNPRPLARPLSHPWSAP